MASSVKSPSSLFILHFFVILISIEAAPRSQLLFREYIGAGDQNVSFSDVPINPNVDFHFILSFAIDYTTSSSHPAPTDGHFNIFWDKKNLNPSQITFIKNRHPNVRVALALGLGRDSVGNGSLVYFKPSSINSWIHNAVTSLTNIINMYNIDGIDIDYEHFTGEDPGIFTECIGRLIMILKQRKVIKFASIAPYEDDEIQSHYQALWKKYGYGIDYVNFQFYAYDEGTTVSEFLKYFETQSSTYKGGKMLVSFGTDTSGGLKPKNGFFTACRKLKSQGKLHGIFIWSADDSKARGFTLERQSQALLAPPKCNLGPFVPCD